STGTLRFSATVSYYTSLFFFTDAATTEIYTLSLHDALPISIPPMRNVHLPARVLLPAEIHGSSRKLPITFHFSRLNSKPTWRLYRMQAIIRDILAKAGHPAIPG